MYSREKEKREGLPGGLVGDGGGSCEGRNVVLKSNYKTSQSGYPPVKTLKKHSIEANLGKLVYFTTIHHCQWWKLTLPLCSSVNIHRKPPTLR